MWKLKRYLKPYLKATLLAPLLMVLEVAMDLFQPKLMANIINNGVVKGDLSQIQKTGLMMLGIAVIGLLGGVGCTIYSSIASLNFATDLRSDLFKKVQSFPFRNLDQFKAGSLITRLTNDVVQLQNLVQMALRILVRAPFMALGSIIMAVTISPRLALILAVATPLLCVLLYYLIRFTYPLYFKVQGKLDGVNTVVQENLAGIRVVKAFVRSDYETDRFSKANNEYTGIAITAARVMALSMPVMMLILNGSIVAVLWFGGHLVWVGSLKVGDLIAFINYASQVLFSLLFASMLMVNISQAKVSADRVNEVLQTESEMNDHEIAKTGVIRSSKVVFDNVSFSYNANQSGYAVKDLRFVAESGKTLAILGSTGAGKSTLVNLIPRLYDASSGRVLIDGIDVRTLDLLHLRSLIGMVLQESFLFTGTIRDNVRFGKPDASQEEVEAAAKAAEAHAFIMMMPEGYDTQLGQRGVNLSGGQKQRISIARALLVRPAILILDDSTSAVDLGTESRIQRALKELMKESTTFLIAQRISSVLEADKILVLDDGRIVAEGPHHELIRTSAVYRDIYESQLGRGDVVNG